MHIVLYSSVDGDWEDLFIDGIKVWGAYSIDASQVLRTIAKRHKDITFEQKEFSEDDMENNPDLGSSECDD